MFLSFVIPLLNEAANLEALHQRLAAVCERLGCQRRIIFVDDGSTDDSPNVIRALAAADPTVMGIRFSRNFGHEVASTAGLDQAIGDAAILMDADLQDPPETIGAMVEQWQAGHEIVYAVRRRRDGETSFKRTSSWLFYRLLNRLSEVPIPLDAGDFRLMDAKVVQAVQRCREQDRFMRGLVAWSGFRATSVEYDRPPRAGGRTHYSPFKLLMLSLDAFVGFSILPLRFATAAGFIITLLSLTVAAVVFLQRLFFSGIMPLPGYALLATGLFFLGGVQMLILGILGEYVGRIYRQTQARPLYLITEMIGACPDAR